MKSYLCLVICLIVVQFAHGKTFTRCELAKELKRLGFNQLQNWVCLIEAESSRNTASKGGPNKNGSYDWGLFQINDRYWCGTSSAAGGCRIKCDSLLTDDITVATNCAKKIWRKQGWWAWYGWVNKCKGKTLPDLSSCNL